MEPMVQQPADNPPRDHGRHQFSPGADASAHIVGLMRAGLFSQFMNMLFLGDFVQLMAKFFEIVGHNDAIYAASRNSKDCCKSTDTNCETPFSAMVTP